MKRSVFLVLLTLVYSPSYGQTKQVCFTIDDLPLVPYGITDTVYQNSIMNKLIASLKANEIPAIGFVNETKLYNNGGSVPFQTRLLNRWVVNNLALGNHTFSHLDYNSASLSKYSQDILKGELITREILKKKNSRLQYFRHPYLHTGNSKEKSDSLNLLLDKLGYTVAPVTIDNEDYLFALAYKRAGDKQDHDLMVKIGSDYVLYMENKLKYYENQARKFFGRDISQVLLLHASLLNSDYMDSLAEMFRRNGYNFVTIEKALVDDAYKTSVNVFGNWGISWIDRWALSQGQKGAFFSGDPETPDYIKKLSN